MLKPWVLDVGCSVHCVKTAFTFLMWMEGCVKDDADHLLSYFAIIFSTTTLFIISCFVYKLWQWPKYYSSVVQSTFYFCKSDSHWMNHCQLVLSHIIISLPVLQELLCLYDIKTCFWRWQGWTCAASWTNSQTIQSPPARLQPSCTDPMAVVTSGEEVPRGQEYREVVWSIMPKGFWTWNITHKT